MILLVSISYLWFRLQKYVQWQERDLGRSPNGSTGHIGRPTENVTKPNDSN